MYLFIKQIVEGRLCTGHSPRSGTLGFHFHGAHFMREHADGCHNRSCKLLSQKENTDGFQDAWKWKGHQKLSVYLHCNEGKHVFPQNTLKSNSDVLRNGSIVCDTPFLSPSGCPGHVERGGSTQDAPRWEHVCVPGPVAAEAPYGALCPGLVV